MPARLLVGMALGLVALAAGLWSLQRSDNAAKTSPVASINPARLVYPGEQQPTIELNSQRREPIRSVLNVHERMRFGQWVWDDRNVPRGPVWIRVDLGTQIISVFRGGHEIGTAVVLYGAADKPSPAGTFPVLRKAATYRSRTYDADMPWMLQLTRDGVAIHGAVVRRGAATHGCIGVPIAFARRLFGEVSRGDLVLILAGGS